MTTDILDSFVPERPKMPVVSRNIYNSSRYVVCLTRAGLIVQSHRTGVGVNLPITHPQFQDYVDAFDTAIDADESNALCRALLSS